VGAVRIVSAKKLQAELFLNFSYRRIWPTIFSFGFFVFRRLNVDRSTILIYGVLWLVFGIVWFYRAYRRTKLERHMITLISPEPRRMVRSDRVWAIILGTFTVLLGIMELSRIH